MFATVLLAAEKTVSVKAKNPILPEGKEILWAAIAFFIVFGLLAWKAWPAIKSALEARQEKIREDLAKAEAARVEAETSLEEYKVQLADARRDASTIIEEARVQADQVRQELLAKAETDAAELRARAAEDIRLASERAMSDVQGRVAELSIELAEKVVERNLDRDTQIALIESYINQVENDVVPASPRVEAYANALLEVSRAEGQLAEVEDELFRFARTFEGSDELRTALTDPVLPMERRVAVVDDLLGGKALLVSAALASFLVAAGRTSELPAIVDRFVELAAAERQRAIAEVRSAINLTQEQIERLRLALNHATGKEVEVKIVVDPTVLGGLVAKVGDFVIDGSVRHRLEQLREQI